MKQIKLTIIAIALLLYQTLSANNNIILINVDDDTRLWIDHYIDSFPNIKDMFIQGGISFNNYVNVTPVCGPSRSSLLTGLFPHNTTVLSNKVPTGGYGKFYNKFGENELGMWMKNAGYRTVLIGKYLNQGYPEEVKDTLIPNGWQHAAVIRTIDYHGFRYHLRLNEGIPIKKPLVSDCLHRTNFEANYLFRFMDSCFTDTKPFFIYFAPFTPHIDTTSNGLNIKTALSANLFTKDSLIQIVNPLAYNEIDISDKSAGVANSPLRSPSGLKNTDEEFRNKMRGLKDIDNIIGQLKAKLVAAGKLSNTYIFFTSDNGYMLSQHRLYAKPYPYEECIKTYLFVRGPNVAQNTVRNHLVANIDLAPTFLEIAGGVAPFAMDGKSLVPLFDNNTPQIYSWRKHLICSGIPENTKIPRWWALRGNDYILIKWDSISQTNLNVLTTPIGATYEYYNLITDPYQLNSTLGMSNQTDTLLNFYKTKIDTLNLMLQCQNQSCYLN